MTREVFKEAKDFCFTQMIQMDHGFYSVLSVHTLTDKYAVTIAVTPVPIPNTVVKLLCADDTWRVTAWESKTLPLICFFVYFFGELECSFLFCFDKAFLSIHDTQFHDSMV